MATSKIKKIALATLSAIAVFCMALAVTVGAGISRVGFADSTTLSSFKVLDVTQVKIDFEHDDVKNAIRFVTEISKDELESLSDSLDNVTVTTIIVRTDRLVDNNINTADDFTVASLDKYSSSFGYKTVVFSNEKGNLTTNTVTEDGKVTAYRFNACLYNLTDENYMKGFSARSYITTGDDSAPIYTPYEYNDTVATDYDSLWNIADRAVTANTDSEGNLATGSQLEFEQLATLKGFCPKLTVNAFDDNVFTVKVVPDTKIEAYKDEITKNATEEGTAYWKKDNSLTEGSITDTVTSETATAGKAITLNMATYQFKANDEAENSYMVATAAPLLDYFGGTFIVPATYNGKPVTRIAGNQEGANTYSTGAFHGKSECNPLFKTKMKKVVLPESVTEIGSNAFSNANYLETIIMPSVTTIGDNAFCYCNSLKEVVVGKNLVTTQQTFVKSTDSTVPAFVGFTVYALNDGLTVSLYSTDKNFWNGNMCYFRETANCKGAWNFNADGDIVTGNGEHEYATYGSSDGYTGICKHCNENQTADVVITYVYDETLKGYKVTTCTEPTDSAVSKGVEIYVRKTYNDGTHGEKNVVAIGEYAFRGTSDSRKNIRYIKKVVLPDTVTEIGTGAFMNCYALESIIMEGVTKVSSTSFYRCRSLEIMVLGNSITAASNTFECDSTNTKWESGDFDYMSQYKTFAVYATKEDVTIANSSSTNVIWEKGSKTVYTPTQWEYDSNGNPVLKSEA